MAATRDKRRRYWQDYAGGLVMFAAEAAVVVGLLIVAWVFSIVILAFF